MNSEELKRVEQLKYFEMLLSNCIGYLWEIWSNEDTDTIKKSFKRLGFREEDLDYWGISEELKDIEEEIKNSKGEN